ncbi:MAG TPA: type II toxin-antitoxin system VapC family toxin [Conexibacter sp.]|jgi:predicted nucleic acid-binding protein|nr:type II toxin-antitoxin system VapC family toxin [Conexibacter sp.]
MIVYVDSSLLTRAYLPDENGHGPARELLANRGIALVTGRLTRIEVSGALSRAVRAGRHPSREAAFAALDSDLGPGGRVVELNPPAHSVEQAALALVREHGLRTLDALHLAVASIVIPQLADKGEPIGFASRDGDQATVAESLGFAAV